ncbi:hypothetical protein CJ179_49225 [Rhodococcus sp. ACS1]|uniref:Uncharacterized protein n=1 Tax=Rhodococcus jostii TaxID=132919 RepID=A0A1H5LVE7_RHOJO|nr:hypothetical protein CJ179_49225 [Rhodococcus sp. ACS1]SEE80999.1 hypothetical protein SAMN04490220_8444 [Rhodococcus jostii]
MTNTAVDATAALQVTEYWVVEVDRHDGTCCTFGPFTADAAWTGLEGLSPERLGGDHRHVRHHRAHPQHRDLHRVDGLADHRGHHPRA